MYASQLHVALHQSTVVDRCSVSFQLSLDDVFGLDWHWSLDKQSGLKALLHWVQALQAKLDKDQQVRVI